MTNKPMLSVERELLERLTENWNGTDARIELRALLDEPAKPIPECVGDLERFEADDGVFVRLGDVIDMLGNETAVQQQVEPVAELQVAFFEHGPMATISWFTPSAFEAGATKLYVEQPAPVAVVMPDRLDLPHRDEFESADQYAAAVGEAKKWNEALDEVARLNEVKP